MMVLFENDDWLVVNKPTKISTHGAWAGDLAALEWLGLHFSQDLFVVSRLDKGTSGVLPFAKTAQISGQAQQTHENETAAKQYLFVSASVWSGAKVSDKKVVETALEGKSAHTGIIYLGLCALGHLFQAHLSRGRTHQVRRHAAELGVPLLGDGEYQGQPFARLMLHCHKVLWPGLDPWVAPIPQSFSTFSTFAAPELDLSLLMQLEVCFETRNNWLNKLTTAFRLIHREEIQWQGLDFCVDQYGEYLSCWNYGDVSQIAKLQKIIDWLIPRTNCKGAVLRNINKNSHKSGLFAEQMFLGQKPPAEMTVTEFGLAYKVTLSERQHLGLFLDQRDNRKKILKAAEGKRVLNLFSYTCSFSVCAAAAKCEVVMSVDSAKSALEIGKANFALNGLAESGRGKFIVDDVRVFLARQLRKLEKDGIKSLFDIIVCDPPTFSKASDFEVFSVEKEWEELAENCAKLCSKEGVVYFSNNHRTDTSGSYETVLRRFFTVVTKLSQPMDFPEKSTGKIHVKQFVCSGSVFRN